MSTYGATAVWGPAVTPGRPIPRLTRRGRLIRFVVLLAMAAALAVLGVGRLTGEQVRATTQTSAAPLATVQVVVEQGDSLWNIAQRLAPGRDPRDTIHEIRQLNGLRGNLIQPGQVLLVPSSE